MHQVFEDGQQRRIDKFSQAYRKRKMKLSGHAIRTGNEDPLRQVTFMQGNIKSARFEKRRAGKPKFEWSREWKKQLRKKNRHGTDQSERQNPHKRRKHKGKWSQDVDIMNWALDRKFENE